MELAMQRRPLPRIAARRTAPALRIRLACRFPAHGWLRVAGRVSPLERVMRRAAVPAMGMLNVHLHVAAPARRPAPPATAGGRAARTARETPRATVPAPRPAAPLVRHVLRERLVERIAGRAAALAHLPSPVDRMPVAPAPRHAGVAREPLRGTATRTELVMVRAPAIPSAASAAPATAAPGAVHAGRGADATAAAARGVAAAAPLALPAQELSRLTDHVIRQLDRRVLSWQERHGRV